MTNREILAMPRPLTMRSYGLTTPENKKYSPEYEWLKLYNKDSAVKPRCEAMPRLQNTSIPTTPVTELQPAVSA